MFIKFKTVTAIFYWVFPLLSVLYDYTYIHFIILHLIHICNDWIKCEYQNKSSIIHHEEKEILATQEKFENLKVQIRYAQSENGHM